MSILTWWNILEDTKHSDHSSKNDEEPWAAPWCICLQAWFLRHIGRQIKQGIVIEEGKVWAALRHGFPVAGNLKVWMIMIPLLIENTATRVASGTCCSRIGRCRVLGGRPDRSYIFRSTPGRVNEKPDQAYKSSKLAVWFGVWKLIQAEIKPIKNQKQYYQKWSYCYIVLLSIIIFFYRFILEIWGKRFPYISEMNQSGMQLF